LKELKKPADMLERAIPFGNYQFSIHAVFVMVVSLLIFAIGLMILVQTKRTVKDIAFFLFCMSATLWLFTMGFVYSSPDPQTALRWYKTFTFFGVINLTPNLYLFAASASGLLKKQRNWVVLTYAATYIMYVLALTTEQWITMPYRYFWGYYPHYEPPAYLFLLTFAIVFWANQAHLKLAYERENVPIKRNQIRLIKLGLLFGLTAFIDFGAKIWKVSIYPMGFVSMLTLVAVLAYSIVRYKAFDIETVFHKTILWILSFLMIIIPIFLAFRLCFALIENSVAYQALFFIVSFFVLTIYLRLVQPKVDHLFQRRKADLEVISSQFAADVVYLKGFERLIQRIEKTVMNTIYPSWVDIFIYDENLKNYQIVNREQMNDRVRCFNPGGFFLRWLKEKNKIVHKEFVEIDPEYASVKDNARGYFGETMATVAIPLVINERLLGIINLGKKINLKRYNALDFHFLTTLKNQSSIAISNSRMYQNIEEQVKERTQELVEVQKQLIQAEKLATVGTLSGGVAHEINNPLTAILINVQMLLSLDDNERAKDVESLKLIEEATQRCRTIVEKLMAYAKKPLENDAVSATDIKEVLHKTIAFIGYQLEQDNIQIVIKADQGPHLVLGNHNELEQVFTNIILNARDAIKEAKGSRHIHVSLCAQENQIRVEIKDQGSGISEQNLAKIFDPFFTTKDIGKGLGLGLSICQSIVEKYHGRIVVQSELGTGTVFTINFPEYSKKDKNGILLPSPIKQS
jgi:signal transduction histidine kinase